LLDWFVFGRFLAAWFVLLGARGVRAEPAVAPNPRAYALVIGSNPGGTGQETLRYAERDARRVRQLLTEIGAHAAGNVKLLERPSPAEVEAALDGIREQVQADHARGQDATFFFYYSGHARANALNLGDGVIALTDLRARLTALQTALTIVVLDACQSGVFERVKGAAATADFSFNSVASLNTRGLAVMASSSSTELSQESERLTSSYFTHYLVLGLRGAGDSNEDGRVSLDEAYRYAYAETLAATARTRVGGQHVTLETELTGRGDVPVTYPASESSQLVLPGAFEGQLLLQTRRHHAVVAEVSKVKGSPLRLALPSGAYDGVVRQSGRAWSCALELADDHVTTLELGACAELSPDEAQAKGDGRVPAFVWPTAPVERELWSIEFALGGSQRLDDTYVKRLGLFGYEPVKGGYIFPEINPRWMLGAARRLWGPLFLMARFREFDSQEFAKNYSDSKAFHQRNFGWTSYALSVGARASWEPLEYASLYGQLELGPALAQTSLEDRTSNPTVDEKRPYWGFFGEATVGGQIDMWKYGGLFAELAYAFAPVAENLLGDTHDSGGIRYLIGFRGRIWGTP
jgi:uncharacterized caspase-like protein